MGEACPDRKKLVATTLGRWNYSISEDKIFRRLALADANGGDWERFKGFATATNQALVAFLRVDQIIQLDKGCEVVDLFET
jgi:hypothetical protein